MINNSDIKNELKKIPKGTTMTITQIQDYIQNRLATQFTSDDYEPYTETRDTNYPRWKHRLQSALSDLKRSSAIQQHDPNNSYTF